MTSIEIFHVFPFFYLNFLAYKRKQKYTKLTSTLHMACNKKLYKLSKPNRNDRK